MKGRRHLLDDGHELRLVLLLAPDERLELGDELLVRVRVNVRVRVRVRPGSPPGE